eukprot:gene14806-17505_t
MTTSNNEVECLVENSANLSITENNNENNTNTTDTTTTHKAAADDTTTAAAESTTPSSTEEVDPQQLQPQQLDPNLIKHPLQNKWSLWYDFHNAKISQDNWGDALKKIISFDTVEDFWCVFNNLPQVSTIRQGSSFHLFKDDIEPKWEHEQNKKGGKWSVQLKDLSQCDNHWLQTVMACVGETFDSSDEVCGLVFNSRKGGHKLTIWTKHGSEKATKDVGYVNLILTNNNI